MKVKILLWVFLGLVFSITTKAQNYLIDSTWSPSYTFSSVQYTGKVYGGAIVDSSNGDIMISGDFCNYSAYCNYIRFKHNGTLDYSFTPHQLSIDPPYIISNYLNGNYLILFGPSTLEPEDHYGNKLDTSFFQHYNSTGFAFARSIPKNLVGPKIIIGGDSSFIQYGSVWKYVYLARYFETGVLDTTFNHSPNGSILKICNYGQENYLLGGKFDHFDNFNIGPICKVDTSCVLDTNFRTDITRIWDINDMIVDKDGSVLVLGLFTIKGRSDTLDFVKLKPNGQIDSSFNTQLKFYDTYYHFQGCAGAICKTDDKGYLIGGSFGRCNSSPHKCLVKVDSLGNVDSMALTNLVVDTMANSWNNLFLNVTSIIRDTGTVERYFVTGSILHVNGQLMPPIFRIKAAPRIISVVEASPFDHIKLFPNPANESCTIDFGRELKTEDINIFIEDIMGKRVSNFEYTVHSNSLSLNCSSLSSGLYHLFFVAKSEKSNPIRLSVMH